MAPDASLVGLLASRRKIYCRDFSWTCCGEMLEREGLLFCSRGRDVHAVARRRRDKLPQVVGPVDAVEDKAGVPVVRWFADRDEDIGTGGAAVEAEEDTVTNDAVLPGGHCFVVERELERYVGPI